jgi:ribosomal protein L7/L12
MSEISDEQWQEIEAALFAGRKIAAIKAYRAATGQDLKASKDAVEEYEAELRKQFPEKFTAGAASPKGCSIALLFLGAVIAAVVMLLFKK